MKDYQKNITLNPLVILFVDESGKRLYREMGQIIKFTEKTAILKGRVYEEI